jgi:hypothetical protein
LGLADNLIMKKDNIMSNIKQEIAFRFVHSQATREFLQLPDVWQDIYAPTIILNSFEPLHVKLQALRKLGEMLFDESLTKRMTRPNPHDAIEIDRLGKLIELYQTYLDETAEQNDWIAFRGIDSVNGDNESFSTFAEAVEFTKSGCTMSDNTGYIFKPCCKYEVNSMGEVLFVSNLTVPDNLLVMLPSPFSIGDLVIVTRHCLYRRLQFTQAENFIQLTATTVYK